MHLNTFTCIHGEHKINSPIVAEISSVLSRDHSILKKERIKREIQSILNEERVLEILVQVVTFSKFCVLFYFIWALISHYASLISFLKVIKTISPVLSFILALLYDSHKHWIQDLEPLLPAENELVFWVPLFTTSSLTN